MRIDLRSPNDEGRDLSYGVKLIWHADEDAGKMATRIAKILFILFFDTCRAITLRFPLQKIAKDKWLLNEVTVGLYINRFSFVFFLRV